MTYRFQHHPLGTIEEKLANAKEKVKAFDMALEDLTEEQNSISIIANKLKEHREIMCEEQSHLQALYDSPRGD